MTQQVIYAKTPAVRVSIFRNLLAIRFVRCAVAIPGGDMYAGGAGFTLGEALAKCHSELAERQYELLVLQPAGVFPEGIAAHYCFERAKEFAFQEATEVFCVRQIHAEAVMRCVYSFSFRSFTLGLSRTSNGYFCFIRGTLLGKKIAAHSAARTALGTVLKAWEEYQSFRFYKPVGESLKNYSKANRLFSQQKLEKLRFEREQNFVYRPQLHALSLGQAVQGSRKIVYVYRQ